MLWLVGIGAFFCGWAFREYLSVRDEDRCHALVKFNGEAPWNLGEIVCRRCRYREGHYGPHRTHFAGGGYWENKE